MTTITQNNYLNPYAAVFGASASVFAHALTFAIGMIFFRVFTPQNETRTLIRTTTCLAALSILNIAGLKVKEKNGGLREEAKNQLDLNRVSLVANISTIASSIFNSYLGLSPLSSFLLTTTVSAIVPGIAFRNQELSLSRLFRYNIR